MMKRIILLAVLLVSVINVSAQILEPVKWSTNVNKISDTEYELVAIATIDSGWHLYSQNVPEGGPIATSFSYEGNGNYLKKGNTKEGQGVTVDDPIFNMRIKYFSDKATFKQRIKLKTKEAFKVKASVEFMVCDDKRCLPPTEEDLLFEVK